MDMDVNMTITIKIKPFEFQSICEIINQIEESDRKNNDYIELSLNDKHFVSSVFKRIVFSAKRKADRLEALGSEVRNSLDFACCK